MTDTRIRSRCVQDWHNFQTASVEQMEIQDCIGRRSLAHRLDTAGDAFFRSNGKPAAAHRLGKPSAKRSIEIL